VYKSYPATSDVRSTASSMSVLFDGGFTPSPAVGLVSANRGVTDRCIDITAFGDTCKMVHCLAEHVVYGEYSNNT